MFGRNKHDDDCSASSRSVFDDDDDFTNRYDYRDRWGSSSFGRSRYDDYEDTLDEFDEMDMFDDMF
jgi:hypothetical protein